MLKTTHCGGIVLIAVNVEKQSLFAVEYNVVVLKISDDEYVLHTLT